MKKYIIWIHTIFFLLVIFVLISGCSKKDISFDDDTIAIIGNHKIALRDFQLNYEFGFANLKAKGNEKLSYLEYMIDEALLSQEGYRLKLNQSESVLAKEKQLLNDLLVEELFKKEVDEKIHISDDDIKEAISKSRVKWKLRYWVEPSQREAEKVYHSIQQNGYEAVIGEKLSNPEIQAKIQDYETDYLTWLDIPELLLEAIKDLPVNTISQPIEIDNVFILVEITEISSNILSESDYQTTWDKYKQILFYKEQKQKTGLFLNSFMNPKQIVTKVPGINSIINAFVDWKKLAGSEESFETAINEAKDTQADLLFLKQHYSDTLVTFRNGFWTIEDFISRFNPADITAIVNDKRTLGIQINRQLALALRNYFFTEEANKQNLNSSVELEKELSMWRDKWVYDAYRQKLTDKIKIDNDDVRKYFETHKTRYKTVNGKEAEFDDFISQAKEDAYFDKTLDILDKKLSDLKKKIPVKINKELLDSIEVLDTDKSRGTTIFLVKGNKKRMAIPMVDPSWSLRNSNAEILK